MRFIFQKGFGWKRCIQVCSLVIIDKILSRADSVGCLLLSHVRLCYFILFCVLFLKYVCILFPISCGVSFHVSVRLLPCPNVVLVSHCLPHPSVFRTCSLSLLCQIVWSTSLSLSQHLSSMTISKCIIVFQSLISKLCLQIWWFLIFSMSIFYPHEKQDLIVTPSVVLCFYTFKKNK